jgi:hypothetical protein
MREVARVRALLAELTIALDALEAVIPAEAQPKRARRLRVLPPETPASPEVVDRVRRGMRRKGIVA